LLWSSILLAEIFIVEHKQLLVQAQVQREA